MSTDTVCPMIQVQALRVAVPRACFTYSNKHATFMATSWDDIKRVS